MNRTLKLTPHESVTIREQSDAALVVEASWGAGGSAPTGAPPSRPGRALRGAWRGACPYASTAKSGRSGRARSTSHAPRSIRCGTAAMSRRGQSGAPSRQGARRSGSPRSTACSSPGGKGATACRTPAFGAYLTEYDDVFRARRPPVAAASGARRARRRRAAARLPPAGRVVTETVRHAVQAPGGIFRHRYVDAQAGSEDDCADEHAFQQPAPLRARPEGR